MNALFRNLTTRQLVVVGLIVPLLFTVAIAWLQWNAVSDMVNGRVIGRQIRTVQVDIGVFRYALSDAESAQFRYILTHDKDDLTLYNSLMTQVADRFADLRKLIADNVYQQKFLDQIEPLLKFKEANAQLSIDRENSGDHAGAMQIISSDDCRQRMLRIEGLLENMQTVQVQLLFQRQVASSHTLKVTGAASVAGLVVNLGCIAAVLLLLRRLQTLQSGVTLEALREMINYEDGNLSIEEYLSRRATALSAHGQAQIEAEKLLSQLERRKSRSATQRVPVPPTSQR